ncbi:hypothetical protein PHJA_000953900 [Phtheirospermum japonicum]|uniref:Uncharacterized protein n=1 Tax=Phtheirospermum japonicum TaxID=374723 RepID=A0A830BPW3_9LAMI|nr:hypothetical protein PHJA_000953900 [Phtheirospermum japonicum]
MEPRVFGNVKQEKEKAMARFCRFRRIAKLWQFLQVLAVLGLMTGRFPAALKISCGRFVELISNYLLNHHVVFLIGNTIIVLLFMLCRHNDASVSAAAGDFYDDYVKYSEAAARQREPPPPIAEDAHAHGPAEEPGGGDGEKQIVEAVPQCDDVAVAIEKATRLIQRFQRTQSERLRREMSVRRPPETGDRWETGGLSEIETLSNEEFRRRVDAFIDKHWSGKGTKTNQFREYENYALLKMS